MSNVCSESDSWKTKPSDRFVLKWIKCHLSARITPKLTVFSWLRPWMITMTSTCLGTLGGVFFALGWAWVAGLFSAFSQVLDGVDGQFARLTNRESRAGAFLDSVLDRYPDGAMVIGMVIYLIRLPVALPFWLMLVLAYLALIGSNQISYSTARASGLDIDLGKPTLASKGTRTSVMIVCAFGAVFWPLMPLLALVYLVIHPNFVIVKRLMRAYRDSSVKSNV